MELAFFNTLTREKEAFKPINPGEVKLYTCGPTVYDYPHIGNFRTYVFEDVLRRWLQVSGYQVVQVMNLTDIDDKTIRGSREKKVSLADYTKPYIDAFFEDLAALRVEPAEYYPKATEHIPEMVAIIDSLLKKGIAYRGDDQSIYFAIRKFSDYGKLAHFNIDELKVGARVQHDEYDKDAASDFALWKAWDPEDGDVFWETPLRKGRPGWHIECSAMSMKYLGPHFDIHTGGVDNIFPHHQNEVAQSEAYSGEKFVNLWLHAEHLIVDGRKMSKSLGNFYTIRNLLGKGFSPLALRYFFVSSHYRNKLNFTMKALEASNSALIRISDFLRRVSGKMGTVPVSGTVPILAWIAEARNDFNDAMNDDLNTPRAVAALHELINHCNPRLEESKLTIEESKHLIDFFLYADRVLALDLSKLIGEEEVPETIKNLILEREEARKSKNFKRSDELRDLLKAKGYQVEDTPSGPRLK